jgi:carboxyl-terminal processing protease
MEGMAKHAKRFVQYCSDYHIKPRKLDDTFGQDVHQRLINYVDEGKLIFRTEDLRLLEAAADSLDNDIKDKKFRYAELLIETIKSRAKTISKFTDEFLASDFDVYGNAQDLDLEYTSFAKDEAEIEQRWRKVILEATQLEILSVVDRKGALDKTEVKAVIKDAKQKIKGNYTDYFESLADLETYFELIYINAIALVYDPHSSYFNEELSEEYSEELTSSQFIFGITYRQTLNGEIEITEIAPGSSAWFSDDVNENDIILSITSSTGQTIDGKNVEIGDISDFFSALDTDSISLELRTDEGSKKVELVRRKVYSDNDIIKSALLKGEKNIGYISLPDFYANWTDTTMLGCANDVAKSLLKLKKAGMDGLILDLRNNGGGSLSEAVDLVGIFINYGPVILLEDQQGDVVSLKDYNKGSIYRGPLIVLVNSESASASEIVAGTLQDYNRALIVGQQSFGKATGQSMFPLDPKMEYFAGVSAEDPSWGYAKTTDVGLYRLRKSSAQQKGITPDVITPHFSPYPPEYERDQPHAIALDSVQKKIYYTPKPTINTSALSSWYASQPKETLISMKELIAGLKRVNNELEESLSLEKSHKLYQQIEDLGDRYEEALDQYAFLYEAESFQFEESVIQMSPYLSTYNAAFIKRLGRDAELNEAYKIMGRLIELQQ